MPLSLETWHFEGTRGTGKQIYFWICARLVQDIWCEFLSQNLTFKMASRHLDLWGYYTNRLMYQNLKQKLIWKMLLLTSLTISDEGWNTQNHVIFAFDAQIQSPPPSPAWIFASRSNVTFLRKMSRPYEFFTKSAARRTLIESDSATQCNEPEVLTLVGNSSFQGE